MCMHLTAVSKSRRQNPMELTQGDKDKLALTIKDFDTPLQVVHRPGRQRISEDTGELNGNINQPDLTDIYRPLHPMTAQYMLFSNSHGIFTKTDPIRTHIIHVDKFKRMKII